METQIAETVEAEFYSADDHRDVQLVKRHAHNKTWWQIRYSDAGAILGFNQEDKAREAFLKLKIQAQNP